jgi:hypothetical protein
VVVTLPSQQTADVTDRLAAALAQAVRGGHP